MNRLEAARIKINEADEVISKQFENRMKAVEDVIAYKMENNLPIFDGSRENEVIQRNLERIQEEKLKPYYKDLIIQMMRISKEYQNAILHQGIYGYQGTIGAFGQIATSRLFPSGKQKNYSKFEEVIKGVLNHEIEKGVLPFENSTTGEVGEVLDLLYKYDVKVTSFYDLKVDQNLMGIKGSKLSDIKKVYSKQQALDQCSDVLEKYNFECIPYSNTALAAKYISDIKKVYSKQQALDQCSDVLEKYNFECIPYSNTALAAKYISECNDVSMAAIAAKESAEAYNLELLLENINSSRDNVTRFIVIENTLPKDSNLIMAMFTVNHESGALAKIMQIIASYHLNMTSIRSRACKEKSWQYYFYVEIEGNIKDENIQACFDECKLHTEEFKVIGCIKG